MTENADDTQFKELDFPFEVLKQTDEGDELLLDTETTTNFEAIVIEKYDTYDDEKNHKWRIGTEPDANTFLVIEEAHAMLKKQDADGFLDHNGRKLIRLTNYSQGLTATNNPDELD